MVQSSLLTFSEEITKYAAELINVERRSHRNPAVLAIRIYTSVPLCTFVFKSSVNRAGIKSQFSSTGVRPAPQQ